jgi:hypothetical protein
MPFHFWGFLFFLLNFFNFFSIFPIFLQIFYKFLQIFSNFFNFLLLNFSFRRRSRAGVVCGSAPAGLGCAGLRVGGSGWVAVGEGLSNDAKMSEIGAVLAELHMCGSGSGWVAVAKKD